MRRLAAIAAALTVGACLAQNVPIEVRGEQSQQRAKAADLLLIAYTYPQVREQCLRDPKAHLEVAMNGYRIPVDCAIWTIWHRAQKQ